MLNKPIVLSLFDGISAGRTALQRANIIPDKYFASEVEDSAIKISTKNWNDIIQIGDVRNISYKNGKLYSSDKIIHSGEIDILIGGSPCQSFSFAGKMAGMITSCKQEITNLNQYLQLKEENFSFVGQSYLFWEYIRLLNEVKPKYFLLENVKMLEKWKIIINDSLGVKPVLLNSSLVSAQNRERLYWVGQKQGKKYVGVNIPEPEDKKIYLKDVLENFDFPNIASMVGRRINSQGTREDYNKNIPLRQCLQVKKSNDKSGTITTVTKDNLLTYLPHGRYPLTTINGQKIGVYEISQIINSNSNSLLKLAGMTVDINGKEQIRRVYQSSGKSPTLTTMQGGHQEPKVAIDSCFYRKLTVKECARLQTFPDNYFDGFKNSPSYKGIGNSWTVDIIVHIFKIIKDL